jgi:dTDP-4-amino-4,6-dideoxygalactose transaminase
MSQTPIPMIDLEALHRPIRAELDAAMARVLDGGRFVGGAEVEAFEAAFAQHCESPHAVGCASGSDALLLALMALGVGPGDQVICPAFSFFATASAIARLGAEPIFVDIDPDTFDIDPEHARERAASCPRLRALLPVDLFGRVAPMDELLALGRELGVPVVEDAAQAVGARDARGATAGSRADVGCFSLYPTKNLGALGDGGILITSSAELAERVRVLGEHGARKPYHHDEIGINSRLDALQAAVLRVKLPHLEAWVDARRQNAARYSAAFEAAGGADALTSAALALVPPSDVAEPARHSRHQYVVRVPAARREGLRARLRERGIASAVYYPSALHQQPCFASLGSVDLPATDAATREVLALPVHPTLTPAQVDRVAATVIEHLGDPAAQ